jgi:selenocysteine-specific elongation factor
MPNTAVFSHIPRFTDIWLLDLTQVKERQGVIERIAADGCSAVCKGLFKKETDMAIFEGATIVTGRGEVGVIQGKFGLSGKFKVDFASPGLSGTVSGRTAADNVVILRHKRFMYDLERHRIRQ